MLKETLLEAVVRIADEAAAEILDVYERDDLGVTIKQDESPLTEADQRAHRLIVDCLGTLHTPYSGSPLPVLSEESAEIPFSERSQWSHYWLVDPLDGTKEFIKRNGEFTVNIALVAEGKPVLGVVHVPVTGVTYAGSQDEGAWKFTSGMAREPIQVRALPTADAIQVVASRSHRDARVDRVIEAIEQGPGRTELVSMGSSLKICLLAEGSADLYPRLAPTSEWDTAAAHGVLAAAGGRIVDTAFNELVYNSKDSVLNPFFIAMADTGFDWQGLLQPVLGD